MMEGVRVDFNQNSHTGVKMMKEKCLPVFKEISCHIIVYVNLDGNLNGKAMLVAGRNKTDTLESIMLGGPAQTLRLFKTQRHAYLFSAIF